MVSILPLISCSSISFSKPLWTVPSSLSTIVINFMFMFQSFFSSLARFKYLYIFSLSFIFTLWSAETAKYTWLPVLIFLLINTFFLSGLLIGVRWSVYIVKSQGTFCVSFSGFDSSLCIYYLILSNSNLLQSSQCITFPTWAYLVLFSFYSSFL